MSSRIAFGSLSKSLAAYRFMALLTGTVLLCGTIGLVLRATVDSDLFGSIIGPLWLAHGYLFMAYLLVTLNLAIHLRWHPLRVVLTMAAGTIPTASFIAERFVARSVRV